LKRILERAVCVFYYLCLHEEEEEEEEEEERKEGNLCFALRKCKV
jgi:hypothetical protein